MGSSTIKFPVLFMLFFIVTNCQCLQDKTGYKTNEKNTHVHNNTHTKIVAQSGNDSLDMTQSKNNDTLEVIEPIKSNKEVTGTERHTASKDSEDEPLPIPIMVASPAVAVAVFVFICVAYKWHAIQLDAQAKELASKMGTVECPSPCVPCSPCSPCRNTQRLLPPSHSMQMSFPSHSDSDLIRSKRKNSRTPSPILLSPPLGCGSHRGSTWSAYSDQEAISHSPRRHSTLLL